MKIKTTISFDPPAGPVAGYGVRYFVNQKEQPKLKLAADATSFDIEVEEGDQVAILLCSLDSNGVFSPAININFLAVKEVPPLRPTNARVTAVVEINPAAPGRSVQLNITDEGQTFNASVTNHPEIKDGAVGTVTGLDPLHRQTVHVTFPASALKPHVKHNGTSAEYKFSTMEVTQPGAYQVAIITPDQNTISLADYVQIQHDLLNVASEVAGSAV